MGVNSPRLRFLCCGLRTVCLGLCRGRRARVLPFAVRRFRSVLLAACFALALAPAGADSRSGQRMGGARGVVDPAGPAASLAGRAGSPVLAGDAGAARRVAVFVDRARSRRHGGEAVVCPGDGWAPAQAAAALPRHEPDGAASEGVIAAQVRQMSRTQLAATFLPAAVGIGYGQLRWQVLSAPPPATCVPRASSRIGCLALFPAKPALSRVHTPRLVGCVPTGPAFVARGPADRRQWR